MKEKKFRAFLAIDLPQNLKRDIINILKPLHTDPVCKKIKWVKEKNLHLTLCFLDDINYEQFHEIDKKIKKISQKTSPFILKIIDFIPFPSPKKFHAVALKLKESNPLEKLAEIIKKEVSLCKITTEKREFKPHITLGRVNRSLDLDTKIFNETKFPTIAFPVTEVKLFKSERDSAGSNYIPIAIYTI